MKKLVLAIVIIALGYIPMASGIEGDTIWTQTYNGLANGSDIGKGTAFDNLGNVYVTGWEDVTGQGYNIWVRKYNASGVEQWTRTYNGVANSTDMGRGIAVDSSGNVYVTGYEYVTGQGNNIWVRKYNSAGTEQWTKTYNGAANGPDEGYGIAVDAGGNVYVTGYEEVTNQQYNIWVRKYNAGGTEQWTKTYNGVANGSDRGQGIAVDSSGNVYVTGYEYVTGQSSNIWVRKYNAGGTEQWTKTYNGVANSHDAGLGIVIDGACNVYVTGFEDVTDQGHNIWVCKYNSAGTEQWTKTYNGAANQNDGGQGIAVDSSGNVYVTGYESVTGQGNNIWVRKYNSAGEEQWTRTYNGAANSGDIGVGIAVDASGDICVAGYEYVIDQNNNIWARKYEGGGPGTVTNLAEVSYQNIIGSKFLSTATVIVLVEGGVSNPNIVVTKAVVPASGVLRGGTLTYTITYTNTGAGAATNVVIIDQIPPATEYTISSAMVLTGPSADITYSHDGGMTYDTYQTLPVTNIKWSLLSNLAASASGSVEFQVRVR